MAKHVIIGKGNLGIDISIAAKAMGNDARIFTSSDGFTLDSIPQIAALQPDYLWVTAGFGSIEQCKANPYKAFDTHLGLPISVIQSMPECTRIGLFSTDYVADPHDLDNPNKMVSDPRSLYALSKASMERAVKMMNRPNVTVFRVSTLYGTHLPMKTLPGRLLTKFPSPCTIKLPQNHVTPTSTHWISEIILNSLPLLFSPVGPQFHNCAASTGTSVMNFGRRILGDQYTYESKGMDWERPAYSNIDCSFTQAPTWEQMWEATREAFLVSLRGPSCAVSGSPSP